MINRTSRSVAILVLSFWGIAGPAAAFAAEPQIDAQRLAITERALEFCGPVDPDNSKKLREKIAQWLKGASPDALARTRGSDDYKKGYASMDKFMADIDPRNAKVVCANAVKS